MKKLLKSLAFLAAAMFAGSALADSGWVGGGAIYIGEAATGGVWYYADVHSSTTDWCTAGAFGGAELGTLSTLYLGGQVQLWDEDNDAQWANDSIARMKYQIDGGDVHTNTLNWYWYRDHNNFFQSGGLPWDNSTFVPVSIDLSGLSGGTHTLSVSFEDYNVRHPTATYTANFAVIGTATAPTAVTGLVYNGGLQTGVAAGTGYTLSGNTATAAGTYTATATLDEYYQWSDGSTNDVEISWSIDKAALTVTANNHSITYGDAPANNGVSYSGFVNGEDESVLSGTLAYAYSYSQYDDVGNAYTITPSGLTSGNYEISFTNGTLTVAAKALTVEADAKSKTYGDADPELTYTSSGLVGSDAFSGALSRAEGEAVGTYEIGQGTLTAGGNYSISYTPANLTIGAKAVTVTADNKGKTYGEADPELTATVAGLVGADTVSYTVSRVPGEDVGTYAITPAGNASQGNYTVTYVPGTFTISAAKVAVPSAVGGLVYDGTVKTGVADGTGYTLSGNTATAAGSYTATATLAANYEWDDEPATGTKSVSWSIAQAPLTVTADAKSKTYGDDDPALTYTSSGLVGSDAFSGALSRAEGEAVGTYEIGQGTLTAGGNYSISYTPANLTIGAKAVTVTADAKGKTYGEADPELTATVAGLLDADTVSYTVSRAAGEDVGTYAITPAGDASQGNYAVSYDGGTFTISAAAISLEAAGYSGTYDGSAYAATVASVDPADATIEWSTDNGTTWSSTAPSITDVGTVTAIAKASKANYADATSEPVTLQVTQKAVTVTADAKGKTYGETDPALTATVEGLLGGDTVSYTVSRAAGEDVGTYAITPAGDASQGNYAVSYDGGTFTISAAAISLEAAGYSGTYDGSAYAATVASVDPADATIEWSTDNGTTWSSTAPSITDVGTVTAIAKASKANYADATSEPVTLQVTQKAVTVTADAKGKTYGETDPALTATVEGLLGGDTVSYTVSRAAGEDVGTYAITPAGDASQGNYAVSYQPGTFTISAAKVAVPAAVGGLVYDGTEQTGVADGTGYTLSGNTATAAGSYTATATLAANYEWDDEPATGTKSVSWSIAQAPLTVTADAKSKTYGDDDPALTYTSSGLVGSDAFSGALSRAEGEAVGTYEIGQGTLTAGGNYSISYTPANLTIGAKAVTVTADAKGKTYGEADPELTATVAGLLGEDTVAYTVSREAGEAVGTYAITPAGDAAQGNYAVSYVPGTFTISAAKVAVPAAVGGLVYDGTEQTGVADGTGYTLSGNTATAAGSYTATATLAANYEWDDDPATGTKSVSWSIAQAPLTVAADAKSKTYGDDDPALTYTSSGLFGSDAFSGALSRAEGEAVGTYEIGQGTLTAGGNYSISYTPANLTIGAKAVTVTADAKGKTYGDADPELTATVEGLLNADTVAYTLSREAGEDVGTYAITPAGDASQGNYAVSYQPGTFTISAAKVAVPAAVGGLVYDGTEQTGVADGTGYTLSGNTATAAGSYTATATLAANYEWDDDPATGTKSVSWSIAQAPLTVAADAKSKTYGDDDPALTYTSSGLFGSDAFSGALSRAEGEAVGTYEIGQGTLTAGGNYSISYTPANLTIGAKAVTVTADAKGKTYGDADPELTATVAGLLGEDTVAYTVSREAGEDVGAYAITPAGDASQGNYAVSYAAGTFTISAAKVAVPAAAGGLVYDGTEQTGVADGTGYTLSGNTATAAGNYTATATLAANYEWDDEPATGTKTVSWSIAQAPLTVAADDITIDHGAAAPDYTYTVTGLVVGESLTAEPALSCDYAQGDGIGTYAISVTNAAASANYVIISYTPGILTVQSKKYTVTFQNEGGTPLQSSEVEWGETPAYTGETPTKAADERYTYTFAGWSPEVAEVTADAVYTATYTWEIREYLISWYNDDEFEFSESYYHGATPWYPRGTPTKDDDAEYFYTFDRWSPELVPVTNDASYNATYTREKRSYGITWRNDDNSPIDETIVEYGEFPTHEDASKAPTAQYTYTFTGWTPAVSNVTGEATYTAQFNETVNEYTVSFVDWDGTPIASADYPYGTAATNIVVPADPEREATAEYAYTFAGWEPALEEVTEDATYTATYTSHSLAAATWIGGFLGDWDAAASWDIGYLPTSATVVTFTNNAEVGINQAKCKTIVLSNNAYVAITPASGVSEPLLHFSGNGNYTDAVSGSGTLAVNYIGLFNDNYSGELEIGTAFEILNDITFRGNASGSPAASFAITNKTVISADAWVKSIDKASTLFTEGIDVAKGVTAYMKTLNNGRTKIGYENVTLVANDGEGNPTAIWLMKGGASLNYGAEVVVDADHAADYYVNTREDSLEGATYTVYEALPKPTVVSVSATGATVTGVTSGQRVTPGETLTIGATGLAEGYEAVLVITKHSDSSELVNTKELPCVYAMPDYDIDVTMTAVLKTFTVTFVDEDGTTVLKEGEEYDYGTPATDIVQPDPLPTKAADAQYIYPFTGWTPDLADVTEDATYTATYATLTKIAVPVAEENLVYNGTSQTGVADGTGYTLSGNAATAAGDYTATAVLDQGYAWEDGTTADKTIGWSIAQKPLTVKADDITIIYGAAAPAYTYTVAGLVGSDALATEPALSCAYVQGDAIGEYTITASGATASANYSLTHEPGILTVQAEPKTYTLVESADDLVVGADYLIVSTVDGAASALKNEANAPGLGIEAVTIGGNTISTTSDAIVWQLKGGRGLGYRVWYNAASNVYAAAPASAGDNAQLLADGTDALAQWTIDTSDMSAVGIDSVSYSGRYLQRDGSAGNAWFAAYDSVQATPRLYRADSTEVQTVTFDPNGGTYMEEKLVMKYAKGREYWGIWKPTWEGHKFLGWYDEYGTNIWNDMIVTEDNTRAVQARWAEIQTVTFDPNGGTLGGKASLVFYRDGVYEGFAKPTRDGYAFLGWFNEAGQRVKTGTDVTDDVERTLYAHWGQTVRFDGNGGTVRGAPTLTCDIDGVYEGFAIPTRSGYAFLGWFNEAGQRVKIGTDVTDDAERTLFAHWGQTVRFDGNGGTVRGKAALICDTDGVYEGFAVPTRDGYAFLGWFNEAGQRVKIGTDVTDDAERTLFAHWGQTVRFDGNGGTVRGKAALICDTDGVYEGFAVPTRDGYAFLGWFDESGRRVKNGDDVTDDAERWLYAHWSETRSATTRRGSDAASDASAEKVFTVDDCGVFPLGAYAIEVTPDEPTVEELGDLEEAEELESPVAVTFQVPEGGVAWRFWSAGGEILPEESVSSSTISLELRDLGLWHLLLFIDDSGSTLSSTWLFLFPEDAE